MISHTEVRSFDSRIIELYMLLLKIFIDPALSLAFGHDCGTIATK
jgi:hypothetical protein